MARRAPSEELAQKIRAARGIGFEFDKVQENLERAGSGRHTRKDSSQ